MSQLGNIEFYGRYIILSCDIDQFIQLTTFNASPKFEIKEIYNMINIINLEVYGMKISSYIKNLKKLSSFHNLNNKLNKYGDINILNILINMNINDIVYGYFNDYDFDTTFCNYLSKKNIILRTTESNVNLVYIQKVWWILK